MKFPLINKWLEKKQNLDLAFSNFDSKKIAEQKAPLYVGINNYLFFQKNNKFNWPQWVVNQLDPGRAQYAVATPLQLINNNSRSWLALSNLIADNRLLVDNYGRIAIENQPWSLEFWIKSGERLWLSTDMGATVQQKYNPSTLSVDYTLKVLDVSINVSAMAIHRNEDYALVNVVCHVENSLDSSLVISIRPYNFTRLGGISSIEYSSSSNVIDINGKKAVKFSSKPQAVFSADGTLDDVNLAKNTKNSISSKSEFCAQSYLYTLKKGKNSFQFAVAIDNELNESGKVDVFSGAEQYNRDVLSAIKQDAASLSCKNKNFGNWIEAARISALSTLGSSKFSDNTLLRSAGTQDYWAFKVAVRMGHFVVARKYLEDTIQVWRGNTGKSFTDNFLRAMVIELSYDYFMYSQDVDYIRLHFEVLRQIAETLAKYLEGYKGNNLPEGNSNIYDYNLQGDSGDIWQMVSALADFSMLARSVGLFKEELRFVGKVNRLISSFGISERPAPVTSALLRSVQHLCRRGHDAMEPIVSKLTADLLSSLDLPRLTGGTPLGWSLGDTLSAARMALVKHEEISYKIFKNILSIGENIYALPEFVNQVSRLGCNGDGDDWRLKCITALYLMDMLVVDYPFTLELFPLPVNEWFVTGESFTVEKMATHFGRISFNVINTENEVQLIFNNVPQFIPPEIKINLPFPVKMVQGSDFILKKDLGQTFIINGWPEKIRFRRH